MSRTLLVVSNPEMRKLLSINLEMYVGTNVICKLNADEVIEYLKQDSEVSLIVSQNSVGDENTILKIVYYVKSNKLDADVVLLGTNQKIKQEVEQVEDPVDWKQVIRTAAKCLTVTAESMSEMEVPDFYPVSIRNFLACDNVSVDIFTKDPMQENSYSKVFGAYEDIDKEKVEELFLKGEQNLYIMAEKRLKFVESFSDQVFQALDKEFLSKKDRAQATSAGFETVREMLDTVGMNKRSVEMAEATIKSMEKMVDASEGLSDLLNILRKNSSSYLYQHSQLIACIAHYTIAKMEWGNKEQADKICFVALFHDVTLKEDHLTRIHTQEQLQEAKLSAEDQKSVLNHALNASQLLKDYPQMPFGSDSIILQHHGMMNGIGFTEEQTNRISPLAITFRVVEEFVDMVMNTDPEFFKFKNAVDKLRKKYNKGNYKKVVDAIEQIQL